MALTLKRKTWAMPPKNTGRRRRTRNLELPPPQTKDQRERRTLMVGMVNPRTRTRLTGANPKRTHSMSLTQALTLLRRAMVSHPRVPTPPSSEDTSPSVPRDKVTPTSVSRTPTTPPAAIESSSSPSLPSRTLLPQIPPHLRLLTQSSCKPSPHTLLWRSETTNSTTILNHKRQSAKSLLSCSRHPGSLLPWHLFLS